MYFRKHANVVHYEGIFIPFKTKVHYEALFSTLHLKLKIYLKTHANTVHFALEKVHCEGLFNTTHLEQNSCKETHANSVHFGLTKSPLRRTFQYNPFRVKYF